VKFEITFFASKDGDSPVIDFMERLSAKENAKSVAYMLALAEHGNALPSNFIKHIEGDLWELRPEFGGTEMRYFYFTWVDEMLVIVHALKKKRAKLPRREITLALSRVKEVKDGQAHIIQVIF
jgi:phage-related protein